MKTNTRAMKHSNKRDPADGRSGNLGGLSKENIRRGRGFNGGMRNRAGHDEYTAMAAEEAPVEPTGEEPENTKEETKNKCVVSSNCENDLVCINGMCVKPEKEGDVCREPGRVYEGTGKPLICSFMQKRLRRVLTRQEATKVINAVVLRNLIISIERGYKSILEAVKNLNAGYYANVVRTGMEAIGEKLSDSENLSEALVQIASFPRKRDEVATYAVEEMLNIMEEPEDTKRPLDVDRWPIVGDLVQDFGVSTDDFTNMARDLYYRVGKDKNQTRFAMNLVLLDVCHTQCIARLNALMKELGEDFTAIFPYVALNPRRCIEKHAMGRYSILYGEFCFDDKTCSSCESCIGMGVCRPHVALDGACIVEEKNCADGLVCVDGICRKRCIPGSYNCEDNMTCVGVEESGEEPWHCIPPPPPTSTDTAPIPAASNTPPAEGEPTTTSTTTDIYYAEDGEEAINELDQTFVSYDTASPPEEVESTDPTMSAYWSIFFICLVTVMAIVITILAVKIHRLRVAFKKQRKSLMSSSPNSDGQSMLDNNAQGMDYASTNRDTFDLTPGNNPSNVRV